MARTVRARAGGPGRPQFVGHSGAGRPERLPVDRAVALVQTGPWLLGFDADFASRASCARLRRSRELRRLRQPSRPRRRSCPPRPRRRSCPPRPPRRSAAARAVPAAEFARGAASSAGLKPTGSSAAGSAPARSAPARSAPARSAPARSAPARSAPAGSGPARSGIDSSAKTGGSRKVTRCSIVPAASAAAGASMAAVGAPSRVARLASAAGHGDLASVLAAVADSASSRAAVAALGLVAGSRLSSASITGPSGPADGARGASLCRDSGRYGSSSAEPVKRAAALNGRVQGGAQRPQIRRRCRGTAADAFGRSESRSADHHADLGSARVPRECRDAEVGQHRPAFVGDQHVAGLDVPVQYAGCVRAGQRSDQAGAELGRIKLGPAGRPR